MHDLLSVPKKQINLPKLIGFGMVAVLILLFASIFLSLSTEIILSALFYWFIINGFLAALGAALARGHIMSIIAAFLSAWLTSLNPFIGAGWVAGLVEVWKREPSSRDLRELSKITSFKELMENRLFRVVLVAAFTNLGSMVGTFLGAYVIFRLYGVDIVSSLRPVFGGLL
jgi:pheromone shutdown-related protein TraB